MAEKRTQSLPSVRVTESLEIALMRSAAADGRELSDYIRRVLELHEFGRHGHSVTDGGDLCQQYNAAHCDARKQ
jgi:hypothetical protein